MTIYLVMVPALVGGTTIVGAYSMAHLADTHSRTITGAWTDLLVVRDQLPDAVREMVTEEYYGEDTAPVDVALAHELGEKTGRW